jgi:transcriptional pleiotropic regulator of transition state genes
MKNTGITRPLDPLGRVTLPIELRRMQNITEGDLLEVYVDGDSIILKPVKDKCVICGSTEDLIKVDGIAICRTHAEKLLSRLS